MTPSSAYLVTFVDCALSRCTPPHTWQALLAAPPAVGEAVGSAGAVRVVTAIYWDPGADCAAGFPIPLRAAVGEPAGRWAPRPRSAGERRADARGAA